MTWFFEWLRCSQFFNDRVPLWDEPELFRLQREVEGQESKEALASCNS